MPQPPRAVLVPPALFAEWHAQAIQTPNLTGIDRAILDAVVSAADRTRAWALPLTFGRRSGATGAEPIAISAAIKHLISAWSRSSR